MQILTKILSEITVVPRLLNGSGAGQGQSWRLT